jgi:hypothetical protein
MMITCINSKKDSLSTSSVALQYAVRAKAITNVARINVDAEKKSEIDALKAELEVLRRRLDDRQVYLDAGVCVREREREREREWEYCRHMHSLIYSDPEDRGHICSGALWY